ncbi:DUF6790 family protein [Isobaculum melis]|uniref:Stearoyl-CoA 9-desaturase n=1 Tax=Isobaculum melis TaxID=142588 RepID=A0A1H9QRY1_9LACT|nr:DUF6790 family protein [Isobaculum melis]SER63222.1 hypothetical protein SAMN04488559_102248 [Isobaculum melis]
MIIYLISYCIFWVLSIIFVLTIHPQHMIETLFLVQAIGNLSFFGFVNFTGHVIKRKQVAKSIGWVSNGFQIEVGFVSLGIGICGLIGYWFNDRFWVATLIPVTTFLLGATFNHIKEMIIEKNFNPGNVLIILPDILIPLTLWLLFFFK